MSQILRIFLTSSLSWGLVGVGILWVRSDGNLGLSTGISKYGIAWFLCVLNLFCLGMFFKQLTDFLSKRQKSSVLGVLIWMSFKLVALTFLVMWAWKTGRTEPFPMWLGNLTYFVVPVATGLGWNHYAR